MKTRNKALMWGTAAAAVGIAIGVDTAREENKLATQVDTEIASIANSQGLHKERFELGKAISVSAAIEKTLDNMGDNFDNVKRAAGAACLVASINGADITVGIEAYRKGALENDPVGYPTALRACEAQAVGLQLTELQYPVAIAAA